MTAAKFRRIREERFADTPSRLVAPLLLLRLNRYLWPIYPKLLEIKS
jgi:hypothetical protein